MSDLELALHAARETKSLAMKAVKAISFSKRAHHIARDRVVRPVDYMRFPEFEAVLRDLKIDPGMKILDISSPQWLSIYLATKHPASEFHYINITDREIDPYREIADTLCITNLKYKKEDARELRYDDNTFDAVISVSVIEHVFPEDGGDLKALNEIYRVIKSGGQFIFTVPYKSKSNIVYKDGAVYERVDQEKNFYAREYDEQTLHKLIDSSEFSSMGSWLICERSGLLAPDYYVWGPGKDNFFMRKLMKSRTLIERLLAKSFDEALAKRYLEISREITGRLVNISINLAKP